MQFSEKSGNPGFCVRNLTYSPQGIADTDGSAPCLPCDGRLFRRIMGESSWGSPAQHKHTISTHQHPSAHYQEKFSMPSTTGIAEALTPASIVNETLRQFPATTGVFNQFGIDACCGGAASISEAATRDGANPDELLNALNVAIGAEENRANSAS